MRDWLSDVVSLSVRSKGRSDLVSDYQSLREISEPVMSDKHRTRRTAVLYLFCVFERDWSRYFTTAWVRL